MIRRMRYTKSSSLAWLDGREQSCETKLKWSNGSYSINILHLAFYAVWLYTSPLLPNQKSIFLEMLFKLADCNICSMHL